MSGDERDFLDEMDLGGPANTAASPESETVDTEGNGEGAGASEGSEGKTPEAPSQTPSQTPTPEAGGTTPSQAPEGFVPLAALMAERDKRQNFEAEITTLRKQLGDRQQQPAAPAQAADAPRAPAKPEDFWLDPMGFINGAVEQVSAESRNKLYSALEDHARAVHSDFDDVMKVVEAEAQKNPSIARDILAAPNPALAAYKRGKELMQVQDVLSDPEKFRAQVRAEVRAELEAEAKAKAGGDAEAEAKRKALAASIPPDITDSPSGGGSKSAAPGHVFDKLFD